MVVACLAGFMFWQTNQAAQREAGRDAELAALKAEMAKKDELSVKKAAQDKEDEEKKLLQEKL